MTGATYLRLMADSFCRFTGQSILGDADAARLDDSRLADAIWAAPQAIVSHGIPPDPIFCFGNAQALALWEMDQTAFTQLPSRLSAESAGDIQADRDALLRSALIKGWVEPYSGIRISSSGRRFEITDTILWNVVDAADCLHGQAAFIRNWRFL